LLSKHFFTRLLKGNQGIVHKEERNPQAESAKKNVEKGGDGI